MTYVYKIYNKILLHAQSCQEFTNILCRINFSNILPHNLKTKYSKNKSSCKYICLGSTYIFNIHESHLF